LNFSLKTTKICSFNNGGKGLLPMEKTAFLQGIAFNIMQFFEGWKKNQATT